MEKKKAKPIILISMVLIQSLLFLFLNINSVKGEIQDDEDLEVTLHCSLNSNSYQMEGSNLIPINTYDFYETPELDRSESSIDYSHFSLTNVQVPIYNSTNKNYRQIVTANATQENKTITHNYLNEYSVSGDFDSIVQLNITFNSTDYVNKTLHYFDNFTSTTWDLNTNDGDSVIYIEDEPDEDCYVDSFYKYDTHNGATMHVGTNGLELWDLLLEYSLNYLYDNITQPTTVDLYHLTSGSNGHYTVYPYVDFNEATITWNNKPAITESSQYYGSLGYGASQYHTYILDEAQEYYYLEHVETDSGIYVASTEHGTSPHPTLKYYLSKNYQSENIIYMQTDETEDLNLTSTLEEQILRENGYIQVWIETNSDSNVKMVLLNNGIEVYKEDLVALGNGDFTTHNVNMTSPNDITFDQIRFFGDNYENTDYFKCYNISVYGYSDYKYFNKVWIQDFNYTVNNLNYSQNIALSFDNTLSNYDIFNGSYIFYFDTSILENRLITQDLVIPNQNITVILNYSRLFLDEVNFSTQFHYSANTYRVPTEVNMRLNTKEIVDESYNSGSLSISEFYETLQFTADENIYFKLNFTSYFTFTFNLEVISKTYLKKTFKLLSDHNIRIERIDLPAILDIKKLYLNNIEQEIEENNIVYIEYSGLMYALMNPSQIFTLEVILSDSIYLPLTKIQWTLGSGTSTLFFAGSTNTIEYNNIDRTQALTFTIPSGYNPDYANLSFDNIRYTPDYTTNSSYNTFGNSLESQSYIEPIFSYDNNSEYVNYTALNYINGSSSYTIDSGVLEALGDLENRDFNNFSVNSTQFIDNSGYYNASYSFECETGLLGTSISFIDSETSHDGGSEVIASLDGHNEVLAFQNDATVGEDPKFTSNLDTTHNSGSIEFWLSCSGNGWYSTISFREGSTTCFRLRTTTPNLLGIVDGVWNDVYTFTSNVFFHIRIDFYSNNTVDLYVNSVLEISNVPFEHNMVSGLDNIYVVYDGDNTDYLYFDAVGYSWDTNYDVGDNYNELANVSAEIDFTLESNIITDLNNLTLFVPFYHNLSAQEIDLSIYNYVDLDWELIETNTLTDWKLQYMSLNENYLSVENKTKIRFQATNSSTSFQIFVDCFSLSYREVWVHIAPAINVIINNPNYVNNEFNITIAVQKIYHNISTIWARDNFTDNNITLGTAEGTYNLTLNITQSGYYTISVFANDSYGNWRTVNITNLFIAKRALFMDILNLKSQYSQNDSIMFNASVRDCLNNAIPNLLVNYTLSNQSDSIINQSSILTDNWGNIQFYFFSNLTHLGFFHINFSIYSNIYLNYSKLMSFELTPIQRVVNSQNISLTVNSINVIDNFIQINNTNSFTLNCLDDSLFSLDIVFYLNRTYNYTYNTLFEYEEEFSATAKINYLQLDQANITNYPSFDIYRYNDLASTNYREIAGNFIIDDLIGETLYDGTSFKIVLEKYSELYNITQITGAPTTESDEVIFEELYLANRSFSYWYFSNSKMINSVSLNHTRTDTIISSFERNGSKYYFEQSTEANDLFIATVNYNPGWQIDFEILTNNGTYSRIRVDYLANLTINNVTVVLDLDDDNCYNENWTLNGTQNYNNFKLSIPGVNFTETVQTLYIEGYSSIPHARIDGYESDQNYNAITVDTEIDFAGFIEYPKFTKIFLLQIESTWNPYNVYYGSEIYGVETMNSRLIKCDGEGFDPSITNSFLHFTAKPFTSVDFEYNTKTSIITIEIESTLDVERCQFIYKFDLSQAHDLILLENNTNVYDLSDTELDGYLYFRVDMIETGTTIIKIEVNLATWQEMLIQSIFMFCTVGGFIFAYYYLKNNEEKREALKDWFNKKVLEKIKRKKRDNEFDKIVISKTEDGKLKVEGEK